MPNLTRPSRVVSGVILREEECEGANVSTCGKSFVRMGGGGQSHAAPSPHPTPSHPRLPGSEDAQGGAGPLLQALLPPGSTEEPREDAGWACQAWVPWSSRGALRTPEAGRLCRRGEPMGSPAQPRDQPSQECYGTPPPEKVEAAKS